ncbi:hypothetical protein ABBQ38_004382 [Trebouxia sp. C0009 RCD-2024]
MQRSAIFIPCLNTDEVVSVAVADLPDDADEMLEVLTAESAPLSLWIEVAKAYLAQGKYKQYERILEMGTSPETEQFFCNPKDGSYNSSVEHGYYHGVEYDRIQVLCSLADYYTKCLKAELNTHKRIAHLEKAAALVARAQRLGFSEQLPRLMDAQLTLARGDVETAKRSLEDAIDLKDNGRVNIAARLALANLLFVQGHHASALERYQEAVRLHPGCPAEVRLGLAACYFRLGQLERAKKAYDRVVQLNPTCAEALYGLAVLRFSSSQGESAKASYREGLQLLCQAYDSDPRNPAVLNLLAHYCLTRKEYAKSRRARHPTLSFQPGAKGKHTLQVKRLAQSALSSGVDNQNKAQSCLILARACHADGQIQEAVSWYSQANTLDGNLPLAKLGLAQIDLLRFENTNAITLLESTLQTVPGWMDALKILGNLYPHNPAKAHKAVSHFKEAAGRSDKDPEVWEMLGELLAPTDPSGALKAYKNSLDLHRQVAAEQRAQQNGNAQPAQASIPARLLNNAAVVFLACGKQREALDLVIEATQANAGEVSELTLGYNFGRLHEANGDLKQAQTLFSDIAADYPDYLDAYLRLACIERKQGNLKKAIDWTEKGIDRAETSSKGSASHTDLLAMAGQLYLDREDFDEAKEYINKVLQLAPGQHDSYALLLKAVLNLKTGQFHVDKHTAKGGDARGRGDPKAAETLQKIHDCFFKALQHFNAVLRKDEHNIYAANGVAAVLAEKGNLMQAREIFTSVQEAASACVDWLHLPDVAINLANLYLAQRQIPAAIQLYTTTLQKHYKNNSTIMLYLARALYDAGKNSQAKRVLLKAIHLQPTQNLLRFNSAVTMQKDSEITFKTDRPAGDPSKLADYERALAELKAAHQLFVQLSHLDRRHNPIDLKKLQTHQQYCEQAFLQAQEKLESAQREAQVLEIKRQGQLKALEAQRAKKEAESVRKAEEERMKQEAKGAALRAAKDRLDRLQATWREDQHLQEAAQQGDSTKVDKRRKKKQKEQAEDEAFLDNGQDEDAEYQQGGSDGEPEYDQDARSKLAAAGLTSDEEEEGQGGASGFDSDSHPAEAGQDATDAVRKAPKGNRKQKRDDKPSRSRSKSRERGTKGTPRLKKRAREPDIEDEEPADTNPAEVDDIMNDQHDDGAEADQALARKNRKAAVVESDEEDEIEQREAGPGVDTEAQSDDDVAARDVNVAEAFGSDSDNV